MQDIRSPMLGLGMQAMVFMQGHNAEFDDVLNTQAEIQQVQLDAAKEVPLSREPSDSVCVDERTAPQQEVTAAQAAPDHGQTEQQRSANEQAQENSTHLKEALDKQTEEEIKSEGNRNGGGAPLPSPDMSASDIANTEPPPQQRGQDRDR
jgi:hypothetical protein